jgi:integrase
MGKRGEYKPPNGGARVKDDKLLSLFDDPAVSWPKNAHWWHYVEEDETFAMWVLNNAAGSYTTAIERGRVFSRFLDKMNWTLVEMMDFVSKDQSGFERKLELFARKQESQGYKQGTINNYFKALRSWLEYNDIQLRRRIKISRTVSKREKVPTPDEIELILKAASPRQAVCVSMVAYGGLRTEVLGQPQKYEGLKLKAFPELDLDALKFNAIPAQLFVDISLSKISLPYRTYIPEPACVLILEYLRIRRDRDGEEITPESPLIAVREGWERKGFRGTTDIRHVRSKTISQDIRKAIGNFGPWRPYDLRHYFMTWLNLAVARGKLNEGYRIYWAGQRCKTADVYDLYKENIPSAIIEEMRLQYKSAQEFLLPSKERTNEEKIRLQVLIDMAKVQKWPENKIRRLEEVMTRPISFEEGLEEFRKLEI